MVDVPLREFNLNGFAQGTSYSISYFADTKFVSKDQVDSVLREIDKSMSLYHSNSLINHFNASTSGAFVDAHFIRVFKKAKKIHRLTQGRFDITVAPLVQLWGFGPMKTEDLPSDSMVRHALANVGMEKLKAKGLYLQKSKRAVKIDLNGIAQGYTVDVLANFFKKNKIRNFMIELGGEIRVMGSKADGSKFKIGIQGPPSANDEGDIKHIVELDGGAITTSGNYQKKRQINNKIISHLIDPKTGFPLQNEMISVTVYAKDAITADGYDNALMAMHVDEALQFVNKQKDIEMYAIYRKPDGLLADTMSTGFKKLIKK